MKRFTASFLNSQGPLLFVEILKRSFLFAAFLGMPLFGADETPSEIRMEEFVTEALKNDPYFQEILIDELSLKYNADLELPVEDFVLDTAAKYVWNASLSDGYRKGKTVGDISLSKLFSRTGTTLSAGYTASRTTGEDGEDAINSTLTAKISQSILENAFGRNTRMLEKRIGLENEVARHQIVEAYEDYLASLVSLYGDWLSAYENRETARKSLASTEELVRLVRRKRAARVALPEDVDRIELELATAKETLILAEQNYDIITNQIRASLGNILFDREIVPVRLDLPEEMKERNPEELEAWMGESRTYRMMDLLKKQGMLMIDIAKDEMLPSAELFAGYEMTGVDYRITVPDRRAYAGVSLSMNFGNQVERANLETAKINLKKTEYTNKSDLFTLKTDLLNLQNRLKQGQRLLAIAKERARLSKKVLQAERYNYNIGKADIDDLIDAQNSVVSAEYQETSRLVELHQLQTEWLRLTDRLVDRTILSEEESGPLAEEAVEAETTLSEEETSERE